MKVKPDNSPIKCLYKMGTTGLLDRDSERIPRSLLRVSERIKNKTEFLTEVAKHCRKVELPRGLLRGASIRN